MYRTPQELWVLENNQYIAYARLNPITSDWTFFESNKDKASDAITISNEDGFAYPRIVKLMQSRGHVVRKDSTVDLKKEAARYKYLTFGQFILGIAADVEMSPDAIMAGLLASKVNLEIIPDKLYELWLDSTSAKGANPRFWAQDAEHVFWNLIAEGDKLMRGLNEIPRDDDLLEIFNSAVLNYAYGAALHKSSKAFIQKSIGIGFLGRVFS